MINVTKTFLPPLEQYIKQLERVWCNGWVTNNGELSKELAASLCQYLGIPHLELVANGTLALQLAIKALDLKGEIITTPYSYVATTNAILWEGCEPVFVDIESNTFCIDPDQIEVAISDKTSAILATHVYGYPCDVAKIQQIADKYRLKVIYDAAHAFGVKLNGQSILRFGDCGCLSFHATKLFHTGEGGAIVSKDEEIGRRVFLMKKFGHIGEDDYRDIGINAKMSELHAAMGICILENIEKIAASRKECSGWYDEGLYGLEIQRPISPEGLEYNYAYYPVIFKTSARMSEVRNALHEIGIGSRRYFHPSLNTLPFLKSAQNRSCPVSEDISSRVLCLPLFAEMSRGEVNKICGCIKKVLSTK